MKRSTFSKETISKVLAIVRIFETGSPNGGYSTVAVLDDGAGISYGISQFTHRSGALLKVVEAYLSNGGRAERKTFLDALPLLRRTTPGAIAALAANVRFKRALRMAGTTREMRDAQDAAALTYYMLPAITACERSGFALPLSLAVIYDSMTHGSFSKIRDRVRISSGGLSAAEFEKRWVTEYVRRRDAWLAAIPRLRSTRYRTRFFLGHIATGRWLLELPLNVNGFLLTSDDLRSFSAGYGRAGTSAASHLYPPYDLPANGPPKQNPIFTSVSSNAQPPSRFDLRAQEPRENEHILDRIERHVDTAAERYDQVERMTLKAANRTDRAKSLWATVAGMIWQTAWAVIGTLGGMPREIWLAAAVIAALLTLTYLYRQITLGRLRERTETDVGSNGQR